MPGLGLRPTAMPTTVADSTRAAVRTGMRIPPKTRSSMELSWVGWLFMLPLPLFGSEYTRSGFGCVSGGNLFA
jgi:hypothetical protein